MPDPNTTELPPTSGGPTARDRGAAARPTVPLAIGPFTLVRLLGAGGMGTVWEATDDAGRRVAVKTVKVADPRLLESIRREIRVLSELVHPGIVRILADGIHDEAPWYAMPLLPGTTLSAHIRAAASTRPVVPGEGDWWTSRLPLPIPSTEVLPRSAAADSPGRDCDPRPAAGGDLASTAFLVRQLCGPLAYMHGEGLVHRDLKPANVLIGPGDVPVIIDFGLMTRFAGARSREDMDALVSGGTAGYVAPEQLRGETVDARADLYALGCLFYELLTGTRPFEGHPSAVIWQHLTVEPAPPSHRAGGVPPEIDDLVMRLLAKDPRNRIGYAEIVDRRLERFTNGAVVAPTRSRPYLYRAGLQGRDEPLAFAGRPHRPRTRAARRLHPRLRRERRRKDTPSRRGPARRRREASSRPPAAPGPPVSLLLDGQCSPGGAWPLEPMQRSLQLLADRCRQRGGLRHARARPAGTDPRALGAGPCVGLDFVETSDAAGLTRATAPPSRRRRSRRRSSRSRRSIP
ncbi:MAG: serine/threonine-protein kinase [Acidobacteriota bacterium]